MSVKVAYMSVKEAYVSVKETYVSVKEAYLSVKETYTRKSAYLGETKPNHLICLILLFCRSLLSVQ